MTTVQWHFIFIGINFLLIYVPRLIAVSVTYRSKEGSDFNQTGISQNSLTGFAGRAQAAHENSFEAFAPFAVSIFVSHMGFVPPYLITVLALSYTVTRIFYITFYLMDKPALRIASWFLAIFIVIVLFFIPFLGSIYFCWFHPQLCNPSI